MTGAQILIESLKREKVTDIFGYPGGSVIPIFDVLYDEKDINLYLVRHELGSVHNAEGFARSTGKVGVCLATSGPGGTNLVTGLATANMDSIPIVAITGQVPSYAIGSDAFQEADITGITRPITKHNYLVKNAADIPRIVREAFYIASTGRPGPVLIDVPKDVQNAKAEFIWPDKVDIRSYKPVTKPHLGQVKKAAELMKDAKKPIIYYGGGVVLSGAQEELREFVKKTRIPVTSTLMGLGAYPADYSDPLYLGMLGMHGTVYANYAISHSDLIIAIGSRFDDRVTGKIEDFAPYADIIHIDIDPASISKTVKVDVPIVGDVKEVLKELNKQIKEAKIEEWRAQIAEWKEKHPMGYKNSTEIVKPQSVIETLDRLTKHNATVVSDVGQHQMWTAQYYLFQDDHKWINSGGLGTMGFSLPAAIGAKIASPKETVICIAGDGSIQMNIQELATVSTYDVDIKIIIMNNKYLGMVRQWQELFYENRYSGVLLGKGKDTAPTGEYYPDFVKLSLAYGIPSHRVDKPQDLEAGLKTMLASKGAYLLEVVVDTNENVFPMVPAGAGLTQVIGGMA